jgi:ABC-type oligopeptide transport system substrate-binding subunit
MRFDNPKIIKLHIDTDPLSLNPLNCFDYIGQMICQALYEPLFTRNEMTGNWQLTGAYDYTVTHEGLRHTFYLDESRRWSNGESVKATDYIQTIYKVFNEKSSLLIYFGFIKNAEKVLDDQLDIDSLGVRALSPYVLQIDLEYYCPYLVELFGSIYMSPSPPSNELNNGPFVLKEYVPEQYVYLESNPYYPLNYFKKIEGLVFYIYKSLRRPVEDFISGKLDITCNTYFPFEEIHRFNQSKDFRMIHSGILFSLQFSKYVDLQMKQVLYQAIDKDVIADRLSNGIIPWYLFIPKGIISSNYLDLFKIFTIEVEPRFSLSGSSIELLYADYYPNGEICQYVKQAWEKESGIKVKLTGISFMEFVARVDSNDYEVCLLLTSPLFSDPFCFFLNYLTHISPSNENEFIEELESALEQTNPIDRWIGYSKVNQILVKDLPVLPLFSGKSIFLVNPRIKGYTVFPDGSVSFREIDII